MHKNAFYYLTAITFRSRSILLICIFHLVDGLCATMNISLCVCIGTHHLKDEIGRLTIPSEMITGQFQLELANMVKEIQIQP